MSLLIFDTPEFKHLESELRTLKHVSELESIINNLSNKLYGIKIITSLPSYQKSPLTHYKFPDSYDYTYSNAIRYICFPYLYYHNHIPLNQSSKTQIVDHILTFDSSVAGCIDSIVKNQTIHVLDRKIEQIFDDILKNNFNFDSSYYLAENIKNVRPVYLSMKNKGNFTALEFWNSLNNHLKTSFINQQIFRSINNDHYKKTQTLKYDITYEQAEQQAIQLTYDFYAAPTKGIFAKEYLMPSQRLILLYLILMLNIQHSSENNYEIKFFEFLSFIQKEKLEYLERETFIALLYFNNRDYVSILNNINKGGTSKRVLREIDNIAWDFYAIRFLETLFSAHTQGDFLVPFFLTFNFNLHHLIPIFPIKTVIIDSDSGYVRSIPDKEVIHYTNKECYEIMIKLISEHRMPMESAHNKLINDDKEILSLIKKEYRKLRSALRK